MNSLFSIQYNINLYRFKSPNKPVLKKFLKFSAANVAFDYFPDIFGGEDFFSICTKYLTSIFNVIGFQYICSESQYLTEFDN